MRRGPSKPALVYVLTPDAERLFQKAYVPVLRQLLDTLARRLPPEALEEVLLATGRSLAATRMLPSGDQETPDCGKTRSVIFVVWPVSIHRIKICGLPSWSET